MEMTPEESAIAEAERAAKDARALEQAHASMTDEEKRDATRKAREKEERRSNVVKLIQNYKEVSWF